MKIYFFIFFQFCLFIGNAQNPKPKDAVALKFKNVIFSDSRKDMSLLDRIYLIAKSINPRSAVVPRGDSLWLQIDLPEGLNLSDSMLLKYAQTYFDAFSVAMNKDSMKFKTVGVQVCNDKLHCGTAWYDMAENNYNLKFSMEEKIELFLQANFWPCNAHVREVNNGKKTIVVTYLIDTSIVWSGQYYIYSFYQSVSTIIGDLFYKSPSKKRNRYEDLLILFFDGKRLAYFWRFPLNEEQISKLYKVKYFESAKTK